VPRSGLPLRGARKPVAALTALLARPMTVALPEICTPPRCWAEAGPAISARTIRDWAIRAEVLRAVMRIMTGTPFQGFG